MMDGAGSHHLAAAKPQSPSARCFNIREPAVAAGTTQSRGTAQQGMSDEKLYVSQD
jgi:hypothetical protein